MSIVDSIIQMLETTLRRLNVTSSAGDSPKINKVLDIDINPGDFEGIFENDMRDAVERYAGASDTGTDTSAQSTQSGITASSVLGLASKGTSGPPDPIQVLTPYMPVLGPVMVSAGVASFLFNWAKSPGGPLDTRYRREIVNESFNFMSRQLQRDTETGHRQVIIQVSENFRNLGGAGSSNTFRQIRQNGGRLANAGLLVTDTATGLERVE